MAIRVTQLYNSNFFSQVGNEYICTGYMFDEDLQKEPMDIQLEKASIFMANQVMIDPNTGEVLTGATANVAAAAATAKSTGGASAPGASSMGGATQGSNY